MILSQVNNSLDYLNRLQLVEKQISLTEMLDTLTS